MIARLLSAARHDVATAIVLFLTAACWPFDFLFDLLGVM